MFAEIENLDMFVNVSHVSFIVSLDKNTNKFHSAQDKTFRLKTVKRVPSSNAELITRF